MKPKTKGGEILKNRRKSALARLEEQLKLGMKPLKNYYCEEGFQKTPFVSLTESDIKRINKEIETLKSRI